MTTRSNTPHGMLLAWLLGLGAIVFSTLGLPVLSANAQDRDHDVRWIQPDVADVEGFDLYLSLEPNSPSIGIDLGFVDADSDNVRTYTLEGLDSDNAYYVMMTSYNFMPSNGEKQESEFSNQVLIPAVEACVPLNCDDGDPCTQDTCTASGCENIADSGAEGCSDIPIDDPDCVVNADCTDDGDVCNGTPVCFDGQCMPGDELSCPAAGECQIASCDATFGCDVSNAADFSPCSAGHYESGACVADAPDEEIGDFGISSISGVGNGQTVSGGLEITALADSGTESVRFYLNGNPFRIENSAPYTFNGDSGGHIRQWDTASVGDGTHTITAVPFDDHNASGTMGRVMSVTFVVDNSVPASEDEEPEPEEEPTEDPGLGVHTLTGVASGQTVSGKIDVRALVGEGTKSVRFKLDGKFHRLENSAPFTFNGDKNGVVKLFDTKQLTNGTHKISATGYSEKRGKGDIGSKVTVTFEVQN